MSNRDLLFIVDEKMKLLENINPKNRFVSHIFNWSTCQIQIKNNKGSVNMVFVKICIICYGHYTYQYNKKKLKY